jgi:hypothetical protein
VQDWQPFAQLAWASCAMKILEAWSAGITILLAGLLPNPEVAGFLRKRFVLLPVCFARKVPNFLLIFRVFINI